MRALVLVFALALLASAGVIPAQAQDWTIRAWGDNGSGQLDIPSPNGGFAAVATCSIHCLGLKSDGSIVTWGSNVYGQCTVPSPNTGFVAVAAGFGHSLGLKSSGTIVAWGSNVYGECTVPSPNTGFVAVAAGMRHSLGLKSDGTIVVWGSNAYGQCDIPSPNAGFTAVSARGYHTLGLKSDGSIVAWGSNTDAYGDFSGQCIVPSPNTGFIAVGGGGAHSLGLKSDGSIVAWGDNSWGQCNVPSPNSGFVAISVGVRHNLGLKAGGTIVAWGFNPQGQCNVPLPNTGFVAVSAGYTHSMGLRPPPQPGSCCAPDGTCTVVLQADCTGTWTEAGVCEPNTCAQPGSCCALNGSCTVTLQADCTGTSTWTEAGICEPNTCVQPPTGSCCAQEGTCTLTIHGSCLGTSTWTEAGVCEPNTCGPPPPIGSCCTPTKICTVTTQANCADTWTEAGVCMPNSCPSPNAGGVLWVHDTGIEFSTDLTLPPVSTPPADCAGLDNEQPVWDGVNPAEPVDRIWKVYAAFPAGSHPRLKTVGWAIQFPDTASSPSSYVHVSGGGPPDENGPGTDFYIGSLGFPTATGGQIGQSFPTGPRLTTVIALFYFYGFGYNASGPLPTWKVVQNNSANNRFFGDDAFPVNVDPIMGYGTLGFGAPGHNPACPIGACCHIDGACTYTLQETCPAPEVWQGEGTTCDPSPCPDPAGVDNRRPTVPGLQVLTVPNPSAGGVMIRCLLPLRTRTTVVLFDASGRLVRRLHEGELPAGGTPLSWDGRDDTGGEVPAGVYLVKVSTPAGETSGRIVLTR